MGASASVPQEYKDQYKRLQSDEKVNLEHKYEELIKGGKNYDQAIKDLVAYYETPPFLPDFPSDGVPLKVFEDLHKKHKGESFTTCYQDYVKSEGRHEKNWEEMTTTDVCEVVLKPMLRHEELSYCDYLKKTLSSSAVTTSNVFISHAWKYKFVDVINALKHHFEGETGIIIWFDLFSNNQIKAPNLPFDWWQNTFMEAIKRLGRVVMVLSPYTDPIPFKRAWCLWEVYCAEVTGAAFEVAVVPSQQKEFVREISKSAGGTSAKCFYNMLCNINVESSDAWKQEDKEKIFNAVRQIEGGFSNLNEKVIGKIREWVITALDESLKDDGLDPLLMWDRRQAKASLLMVLGKEEDAEQIYQQNRSDPLVQLGDGRLGIWYNDMGLLKSRFLDHRKPRRGGNLHEAIEKFELALKHIQNADEDHNVCACIFNNLGAAYKEIGSLEGGEKAQNMAQNMFDKALFHLKEVKDRDDQVLASITNNQADLLMSQHKLEKARLKYKEALNLYNDAGQREHPNLATICNNLGACHHKMGSFSDAIRYYKDAEMYQVKALGDKHSDVATIYSNLGESYRELNYRDEARQYLKKALDIQCPNEQAASVEAGTTYNHLGLIYMNEGNMDKADAFLNKALRIVLDNANADDLRLVSIYTNLGSVYSYQGRVNEARIYLEKAVHLAQNSDEGEELSELGNTYNSLGKLHSMQEEYKQALKCYERALCIKSKAHGEHHADIGILYQNLGHLFMKEAKWDEAIKYYENALNNFQDIYGKDNGGLVDVLFHLVDLYLKRNHKKAATYAKDAIRIGKMYDECIGHEDVTEPVELLGSIYNKLGVIYSSNEREEDALYYYKSALSIKERSGQMHHVVVIHRNLGHLCHKQGKLQEAIKSYEEASKYSRKEHGDRDVRTIEIDEILEICRREHLAVTS
tara:strand:+ start:1376 stop:4126 length:2751 start_codon:yes stop_codon:yes gene_type:complete